MGVPSGNVLVDAQPHATTRTHAHARAVSSSWGSTSNLPSKYPSVWLFSVFSVRIVRLPFVYHFFRGRMMHRGMGIYSTARHCASRERRVASAWPSGREEDAPTAVMLTSLRSRSMHGLSSPISSLAIPSLPVSASPLSPSLHVTHLRPRRAPPYSPEPVSRTGSDSTERDYSGWGMNVDGPLSSTPTSVPPFGLMFR